MVEIQREVPTFAHPVDNSLALMIHRYVRGESTPKEVTSALRRACDESRTQPPEALLLRIKGLWRKVGATEHDDYAHHRYHMLIGDAMALYFDPSFSCEARCGPRRRHR